MEHEDPRAVIYNFLAELPSTIQTEELFFILLYCGRKPSPLKRDEFLTQAEEYLKQPDMAGIGAVLCSMAVIDYRLSNAEHTLIRAERLIKEAMTSHPNLKDMGLLGMPLRRKHYAAALDKWKKLKSSQLSEQGIRDFEENLLNPRLDKEL